MSKLERVFHSVLFEVLALLLSIIGLAIFTDHQVSHLSGTMLIIATIAMLWNFVFNAVFDRFYRGERINRSVRVRIFHSLAFEGGLLIFTIPVVAYFLSLSLLDAFIMDIGITLFILIYAFVFNLTYDHCRVFIINKKSQI